ncbi:MAG: CDP-diacylglycerol--glycerol-3-phosphate 3-phosphatidyltransferase [Acholeplasma sp.]|jgi:CDP-diacylglycerol--glycerol-3-phosphate 3-phosphatidyltransferase|nr:CDP-diacylglycerol--glycerol-3-phosphate 3-phosphatidyltransferase [Acholeplasma sp.]CCY27853.1 cDP-diacylglycerol--glycerol-3-phosphate 3-phosphatidyltransferase [Acholeplasma sp. CAG:878]
MNLPNKLTVFRIFITIFIIIILLFPFHAIGISSIKLFINESIVVSLKYIIAGVLFIIGCLTDFVDGYIARKYNMVTELGKMLDAIADKILVNSVLIILAAQGIIHPLIPVIIVSRDTIVDVIKMIVGNKKGAVAAIKSGKIKTTFMMVGLSLTLFNNLPFELWNLKISSLFLIIATVLSIYSGIEYYKQNKLYILSDTSKITQ